MTLMTKSVEGWWCGCCGPDWHMDSAAGCPRRIRVVEQVPTDPDWRMPHWRAARETSRAQGSKVIEPSRPAGPTDEVPPMAVQLVRQLRLRTDARPALLTAATGWGRRKVDGKFMPVPVHSVALRAPGIGVAVWVRREGESAWKCDAAWIMTEGRMRRATLTRLRKRIDEMTE